MDSKQAHERLEKAGLKVSELGALKAPDRDRFIGAVRLVWREADKPVEIKAPVKKQQAAKPKPKAIKEG